MSRFNNKKCVHTITRNEIILRQVNLNCCTEGMYTQVVHLVLQFKSQTKYRLRRHNSTIKQPHKNFQTRRIFFHLFK